MTLKLEEPAFIESAGTVQARFETIGMAVHVWGGHGISGRFYTGRPVDLRMEGRSFGPEERRQLQKRALRAFLSDSPDYKIYVDSDGDMVATVKPGRWRPPNL